MKLPIKSEETILEEISNHPKENPLAINILEKALKEFRGYVFKMPDPGTPVVSGMSGGADTTTTIAILLEEFGLEVYPFFVNRGQRSYQQEKQSVEYFSNIFKLKYPKLFHDPIEIKVPIPANEIKKDLTEKLRHDVGHPMRNSILTEYGVQYAFSLANHDKHVRNIFCSVVSSDGNYLYHSTLTAMRSLMFHIAVDMGDPSWQVTSLPVEKEMGFYFDKDTLVKWASKHDLPLEKTRTCVELSEKHCGVCDCCYDRKRSFEVAGVKDKTEYIDIRPSSQIRANNN
ncbi:MAG: 7-cyano-7-deazaguanine synthase [Candidatus Collierbacteria bacterium GW2011_GWC2_44_18]|uniref:7-cyano-7-deazaguanine synthase n=1 Tax=Candidatus Collierbacteria bacterium GW2011_GWC2_44_18 TaxID=1618392 RepID=A0A0G1JYK1_9BACT|nr:MAG: 7-cyano-7-deazaguanine synthase [Candidatus Collierbacteria bacterium GW2011_GWC2_44_18]